MATELNPPEENNSSSRECVDDPEGHYYLEKGLMVMTEKYHLKRGYCCGSKCKHCPYKWKKVKHQ